MFIITLECSKWWIWMGIYIDILLIRISRGANNCVQRVFEKNIYFIIFPHIWNSYYAMIMHFFNKRSKGLTMQIRFHRLLWLYLPRVMTVSDLLRPTDNLSNVWVYSYAYLIVYKVNDPPTCQWCPTILILINNLINIYNTFFSCFPQK